METRKPKRGSVDAVTLRLLRRPIGASIPEIVDTICKKFSAKDRDTVTAATVRRLQGYLESVYGVTVTVTVRKNQRKWQIGASDFLSETERVFRIV